MMPTSHITLTFRGKALATNLPDRLEKLLHEAHEAFGVHRGHYLTAWMNGVPLAKWNYHELCDGMIVNITFRFGKVGPE